VSAIDHDGFRSLIDQYLPRVYNFAFRMVLDHDRTPKVVEETFLRAYVGHEKIPEEAKVQAWLLRIAQHVLHQLLPRTPELTFDVLDDTLRSEATRTDVVKSINDPKRDFLLWELKQGCMTSVINCLPPGERAAFTLATLVGMSDEDAAGILTITVSAYKVRLSRAHKKVAGYLAARCEHVDPMNPCRCPARVGIAIAKGFIRSRGEVSLRQEPVPFGRYGSGPNNEDKPLRDVMTIYKNLPDPEAPEELRNHLVSQLESGNWDKVRDEKKKSLNRR
jgi:RNA polymerase sigma factor (sigma-70 family)